tara:strand:- start:43 stop:270 length:228 start_codon:yes stop_codon:yes gene_type:complete
MINKRRVNQVQKARQAAIATRLMTEKIKPKVFIRYFVAEKLAGYLFLSFMLNSTVNSYQTTKTLSSVSFFALYIA